MNSIKVVFDTHVRVSKSAAKAAGLSPRDLRAEFEYENPDFFKTRRMGYFAGNLPRRISLLEVEGGDLAFPRGAWPRVRELLRRAGVAYEVVDRTVSGTGPVDYGFRPPFELGPDQRMAVKLLVGRRQGIVIGPCASGKTTIALAGIARTGERAVVVVHTERILATWIEEAGEFFGGSATVGALYGKKKEPGADLVVATVQTLRNYLEKHPDWVRRFGVCVLDEAHHCFPGDMIVGRKRIENISVGDIVPAFDPNSGRYVERRVTATFDSKAESLIAIEVEGEEILSTARHPFYVSGVGWIEARNLLPGDMVLSYMHRKEGYDEKNLQVVRGTGGGKGDGEFLHAMPRSEARGQKADGSPRMRGVPDEVRADGIEESTGSEGSRYLLERLRVEVKSTNLVGDDAEDEPTATRTTLREDEEEEPHARPRGPSPGLDDASDLGVETTGAGWERNGADDSGDATCGRPRVGERGLGLDRALDDGRESVPTGVQARRREPRPKDRDRSRRALAQIETRTGGGREEGRLPRLARVDRTEILERGRDGTFGGRCPEGRVYNLEVEGVSTYLVGEGMIGVHNCPAVTFAAAVSRFPARYRWAFTATPRRKDGKEVLFYDAFGSEYAENRRGRVAPAPRVLTEIRDEDLDRYGRIVPVDVVVVPTEFEFDLNHAGRLEAAGFERKAGESALALVRRWARATRFDGPLNTYAEMLDEMSRDKRRQARVLEFLLPELKAGKPSILLADRRELCLEIQHWLKRRGIDCGRLMGGRDKKEQERTAARLADGRLKVAVGTVVADEGMNVRPLARGYGCTPAASNAGRFTQQFGRIKRKSPGKADAVYFYFWDRRVRSLRGHARAILNAVAAPHRVWYADKPGRENWRPLDLDLAREVVGEAELNERSGR